MSLILIQHSPGNPDSLGQADDVRHQMVCVVPSHLLGQQDHVAFERRLLLKQRLRFVDGHNRASFHPDPYTRILC